MKESKLVYGFWDGEDFTGTIWETELGKIITYEGKLNPNNNLLIKDVEDNYIDNIDLRNMLLSVLPIKEDEKKKEEEKPATMTDIVSELKWINSIIKQRYHIIGISEETLDVINKDLEKSFNYAKDALIKKLNNFNYKNAFFFEAKDFE